MGTTIQIYFNFMTDHVSDSHINSVMFYGKQCRLISVVTEIADKSKNFKLLDGRICLNVKKRCLIFISTFMFLKTRLP